MIRAGVSNRLYVRWLLAGILVALAAGAAQAEQKNTPPPAPYDFRYVPSGADGLLAFRPAEVLSQPGLQELYQQGVGVLGLLLGKQDFHLPEALRPENFDQVVCGLNITVQPAKAPLHGSLSVGASIMMVRMKLDFDWIAFLRELGIALEEGREKGQTYYHSTQVLPMFGNAHICLVMPDRRTLLVSMTPNATEDRRFVRRVLQPRDHLACPVRDAIASAPLVVLVRNKEGKLFDKLTTDLKNTSALAPQLGAVTCVGLGIELGDGRPLRLVAETKDAAAAIALEKARERDCETLRRLLDEAEKTHTDVLSQAWLRLGRDLVRTGQAHLEGARLSWTGQSTVRLGQLFGGCQKTAVGATGN
jgi:hypothetical protein